MQTVFKDEFGMTPEEVAALEAGAAEEIAVIREYLERFVASSQLPEFFQDILFEEYDYSVEQLAYVREQLIK